MTTGGMTGRPRQRALELRLWATSMFCGGRIHESLPDPFTFYALLLRRDRVELLLGLAADAVGDRHALLLRGGRVDRDDIVLLLDDRDLLGLLLALEDRDRHVHGALIAVVGVVEAQRRHAAAARRGRVVADERDLALVGDFHDRLERADDCAVGRDEDRVDLLARQRL